jgi:hypothetical protein
MAKIIVLAKVKTQEKPGLVHCYGTRAGDYVAQAMALSNGDNVTGIFGPMIPADEIIAQVKPGPDIDCLLLLTRIIPDE